MSQRTAADGRVEVRVFDEAPVGPAAELIAACCASRHWIDALIRTRPHGSLDRLCTESDGAIAALTWMDLEQALAGHPRIGERAQGADQESAWSRQEQSAAATPEQGTKDAVRAGNLEYERRFGHVFLICATGKSAEDVLDALRLRLDNPPEVERELVRDELGQIVRLRLGKTFR